MKDYLTIPQAAKICSVDRSTMNRWANTGKIKTHCTPGGHKRVLVNDLVQFGKTYQMPLNLSQIDSKSKILIVDDDIGIHTYLKRVLNRPFIEIDTASDGFEAGKKIITFNPHLVILDLAMPNMDGFEVCRNIKNDPKTQGIKVLILTGHGTKENQERILSLGADAFLTKPSRKEEILICLESLLTNINTNWPVKDLNK